MKNNLLTWFVIAAVLMLGAPWCAVTFFSETRMGIYFILFFAVNPLFSVIAGIFAGLEIRKMWSVPVMVSGLFVLGTWIFFELGEIAFLLYGGIYLIVGFATMILVSLIKKYKQK